MGSVQTLKRLLRAVRYHRPDVRPAPLRKVAKAFVQCACHVGTFREWFGDAENPALQEALEHRPSLVACVHRPYLNMQWSSDRKLQVIHEHYWQLSHYFEFLRFKPTSRMSLADLGEGLSMRLHLTPWFEHEGELTLSLFQADERLYSIAFSLGWHEQQRVAFIGALQGLGSESTLDIYRTLTHRMEGLRPRDLLIIAFRRFCGALDVDRILAVSDAASVSRAKYFRSSVKVMTSYDSAWIENGGAPVEDGFFQLGTEFVPRDAQQIPSRKRAQYRRRYALIETAGRQIDEAVWRAHCACSAREEAEAQAGERKAPPGLEGLREAA